MSDKKNNPVQHADLALLPNGFADILPPRAESEARSVDVLMKTFRAFGYQRVKPPLLEFEESLLAAGVGEILAPETFRIMDPVSHRMLGVRSDVTPQIARIASSRMADAPRPLRLTYANDVLRSRGSQIRTERQFTQAGCEIIGGADTVDGDVEMCMLAIIGLKSLGIANITMDLNVPNFAARLVERTPDENAEILQKAIERRDYDALMAAGGKASLKIAAAMKASGPYKKALPALQGIFLDEDIANDVVRLTLVCDGLEKALADLAYTDVSITIDVLEHAGFEYHKGLGFTLFAAQCSGELGRGGCYDVRFGTNSGGEHANGFTLYMDTIGKICTFTTDEKKILVDARESWRTVVDLQAQGWVVLRADVENCGDAARFGCSFLYKDGKIVETSNG